MRVLLQDLQARGRSSQEEVDTEEVPVYKIGPRLVREYMVSLAPTAQTVANLWDAQRPLGHSGGKRWQSDSPVVVFDGSTGRQLVKLGLPDDQLFNKVWSAAALMRDSYHEIVVAAHRSYIDVGAAAVTTNSYAVQPTYYRRVYPETWRERMAHDAQLSARLAQQAKQESGVDNVKILGCLPPLVESHRPDLFADFLRQEGEDFCIGVYRTLASALALGGVDAFILETMNSWEEAWCAIRAVQELKKPILLCFEGALRGMDKKPQPHMAPTLARKVLQVKAEGVPLHCLGFNCAEPEITLDTLKAIDAEEGLLKELNDAGLPLLAYSNLHHREKVHSTGFEASKHTAQVVLRKDLADDTFEGYVQFVQQYVEHGVSLVGGCCGCGPEGIQRLVSLYGNNSLDLNQFKDKRSRLL